MVVGKVIILMYLTACVIEHRKAVTKPMTGFLLHTNSSLKVYTHCIVVNFSMRSDFPSFLAFITLTEGIATLVCPTTESSHSGPSWCPR